MFNPIKGKKERIGRLLQMHANNRDEIKEVRAGDIAAAVGLKDVTTGDTLCATDKVIMLEKMIFPEPVIAMAIEPKTKGDQEKMGLALSRLAQEDPSFRVRSDEESGQTIIAGMGELHLDIIVDRMKREFNVEANVGKPQVAYRETIRKAAWSRKASTSSSPAARASTVTSWIKMEPQPRGKGYEFVDAVKGGAIPKEFIPPVDERHEREPDHGRARRLSRSWTSRSRCTSVRTTKWTRTKCVQIGRVDRFQGRHARGAARCCSSRS